VLNDENATYVFCSYVLFSATGYVEWENIIKSGLKT
jgi:hypothetical protein